MQTLHGSPPSHNNTTPSPLAATQLLPPLPPSRRRGSSCYPRLHHCSFPRSFPPTLPPPPSHHLFSGCAAYDSPRALSKVKLTSFYLPPSSPPFSSFSDLLLTAPHIFSPSFIPPLFLPPAFSLSLLISPFASPFLFLSLSLSLFLSPHSHRRRRSRGRDRGRCRAYQTSALGRHRGNK